MGRMKLGLLAAVGAGAAYLLRRRSGDSTDSTADYRRG